MNTEQESLYFLVIKIVLVCRYNTISTNLHFHKNTLIGQTMLLTFAVLSNLYFELILSWLNIILNF